MQWDSIEWWSLLLWLALSDFWYVISKTVPRPRRTWCLLSVCYLCCEQGNSVWTVASQFDLAIFDSPWVRIQVCTRDSLSDSVVGLTYFLWGHNAAMSSLVSTRIGFACRVDRLFFCTCFDSSQLHIVSMPHHFSLQVNRRSWCRCDSCTALGRKNTTGEHLPQDTWRDR